jgi:hypothetical protein
MHYFKFGLALVSLAFGNIVWASNTQNSVSWKTIFSNSQPVDNNTSQQYCSTHIPQTITASVDQLTADVGVTTASQMNIKYSSYKAVSYDNVYFTFINAVISGQDQNGNWSSKMKVYGQSLTQSGEINGVWSTDNCKGIFFATQVGA